MVELITCIGIAILIMLAMFVIVKIWLLLSESDYWEYIKMFIVFLILLTVLVYLVRYCIKNAQTSSQNGGEYKIGELLEDGR